MPKSRSRKRGGPPPQRPQAGRRPVQEAAPVATPAAGAQSGNPFADARAFQPLPAGAPLPVLPPEEVSERIESLDFLRGFAVMGILIANVVMFALPDITAVNPFAWGMTSTADMGAWLFTFLFVDGKMRALFALMFGASMLLVMESAETRGEDGLAAHRRRMWALLPIGIAHFVLLWSGDILVQLAIAGLVGTRLARMEQLSLLKWGLGLIALQWVMALGVALSPYWVRSAGLAAGASADSLASWRAYADALGIAPSATVAASLSVHASGYGAIVLDRLTHLSESAFVILWLGLVETLGFMAFGMAMLKGGFLAGQWTVSQYRSTWLRAWLVGLLPMAGLGAWVLISRDPLAAQASVIGWSVPLRLPITIGYAALMMLLCDGFMRGWLREAIISVGRLALSAYLLSSLVMTTLFYGYGGNLFGSMGRFKLLLVAIVANAGLLLVCWLWRRQWGQGPVERLWRRMARGVAKN